MNRDLTRLVGIFCRDPRDHAQSGPRTGQDGAARSRGGAAHDDIAGLHATLHGRRILGDGFHRDSAFSSSTVEHHPEHRLVDITRSKASPGFTVLHSIPVALEGRHVHVPVLDDRSPDRAVNPDDLAIEVKERSTGVPPDQCAVGLDSGAGSAHDSSKANRSAPFPLKPGRMSRRHHPVAVVDAAW